MSALTHAQEIAAPEEAVSARIAAVKRKQKGSRGEWILIHILYLIVFVFFFSPFLWLLSAAFDGDAAAYIRWPADPTFDNFRTIFTQFHVGITYFVLVLQTMPISATMVPIYGLARDLGLRNSYLGLILVHAAIEMPFLIWLMKGFFDTTPRFLEEAAWLDGRSKLRAWWEVVMPMARPGIAVVAGFAFLNAWSEVLMVIILVDQASKSTVPLLFYQAFKSQGGYTEVDYGLISAVGIIYVLPVIVLFFSLRKLMVRGLVGTSRGL
jgi:ABC-type glycerol-3-phosphate transport system permease component